MTARCLKASQHFCLYKQCIRILTIKWCDAITSYLLFSNAFLKGLNVSIRVMPFGQINYYFTISMCSTLWKFLRNLWIQYLLTVQKVINLLLISLIFSNINILSNIHWRHSIQLTEKFNLKNSIIKNIINVVLYGLTFKI